MNTAISEKPKTNRERTIAILGANETIQGIGGLKNVRHLSPFAKAVVMADALEEVGNPKAAKWAQRTAESMMRDSDWELNHGPTNRHKEEAKEGFLRTAAYASKYGLKDIMKEAAKRAVVLMVGELSIRNVDQYNPALIRTVAMQYGLGTSEMKSVVAETFEKMAMDPVKAEVFAFKWELKGPAVKDSAKKAVQSLFERDSNTVYANDRYKQGNCEEALAVARRNGLGEVDVKEAGRKAVRQFMINQDNVYGVEKGFIYNVAKSCSIENDVRGIAEQAFVDLLRGEKVWQAQRVSSSYLKNPETVAGPLVKEYMNAKIYGKVLEFGRKGIVGIGMCKDAAVKVFWANMKDGKHLDAEQIAREFKLDCLKEKIPAAMFEKALKEGDRREALKIATKHELGGVLLTGRIKQIARELIDELKNAGDSKVDYNEIARLAKQYGFKQEMQDAANRIFGDALKAGDYKNAEQIAKDFVPDKLEMVEAIKKILRIPVKNE